MLKKNLLKIACLFLALVQSFMMYFGFAGTCHAYNEKNEEESRADLVPEKSLADNIEYKKFNSEKPQQLRVCTFNMARDWESFRSKSSESFSQWQIEEYLKLFDEINPDIMCMQEASGLLIDGNREPGDYIDVAHTYNLFDTTMTNRFIAMSPTTGIDLRIVSKYEYSDYIQEYLDKEVSSRIYQRVLIPFNGKVIGMYNVHLSYGGLFEDIQKREMEALCAIMNEDLRNHVCDYTIACGDCNVWDTNHYQVFKDHGFRIANCAEFGNIVTWAFHDYVDENDNNKLWDMSCLDNIIVSNNIEIRYADAIPIYEPVDAKKLPSQWPIWDKANNCPNALSDHYPLYADIILY